MNCKTVNDNLDDFIDGALSAADTTTVGEHIEHCGNCRSIVNDARELQDLLKVYGDTDVPTATTAFYETALRNATRNGAAAQHRHSWLKGFGSAVAAGMALWIVSGLFFNAPEVADVTIPVVTMALEEPRTVNLVFSSAVDLVDATLTVILPTGIEIAGFEGQREISWETSLTAGRNMLPLKLIATSPQGGEILAMLQHDDDDRSFRLQVTVI